MSFLVNTSRKHQHPVQERIWDENRNLINEGGFNKADGFDYFLYWILVGCPYGIRKMCMFLVPKNFGIAGSMGILALNCIVGGLIGGIIVFVRIIVIFTEIIKVIAGHFWTQCPKV